MRRSINYLVRILLIFLRFITNPRTIKYHPQPSCLFRKLSWNDCLISTMYKVIKVINSNEIERISRACYLINDRRKVLARKPKNGVFIYVHQLMETV